MRFTRDDMMSSLDFGIARRMGGYIALHLDVKKGCTAFKVVILACSHRSIE